MGTQRAPSTRAPQRTAKQHLTFAAETVELQVIPITSALNCPSIQLYIHALILLYAIFFFLAFNFDLHP